MSESDMDVIDTIRTTRAIRRFTEQPVSDADIERCLLAAQQAPSGGNVQPQQYVVITDQHLRAAVGEWYRKAYHRYEAALPTREFPDPVAQASWERTTLASRHLADTMGQAPAMVLFLQPTIPWGAADAEGALDIGRLDASVYPAVQNFCVAARSLGLGTALTTVIRIYAGDVLAVLGVPPDRFEIAALVPVGYPQGRFGVAPRKPASAVTHWNTWSNKRR
jgi:nitroreductase